MTEITPAQIQRTEREWTRYAGGLAIRVEATGPGEPIYGFGSELAVRRLAHRMSTGSFGYSTNLRTWYYVADTSTPTAPIAAAFAAAHEALD